ncbi:MAG: DUF1697 domain-containing protein [Acidimicrobiales bacterium]
MSSTTWIALLRGINVGGKRKLAMADLRLVLESLGLGEVRTVLQSGNALFAGPQVAAAKLERQIEAGIAADLDLDVKVLVRTADELAATYDDNPFVSRRVAAKELHVAFLSAPAEADKVAALDAKAFAPDEFRVGERAIYLRLPNGVTGSKLPNWERALGVSVTVRNWNTVSRLRDLSQPTPS